MKKVLIAGAAGFIGSHLCRKYSSDGWEVIGIDNLVTGYASNIPDNVMFYQDDICNPATAAYSNHNYDLILNFACPASPKAYKENAIDTMLTCSQGSLMLLEKAKRDKCTILMASTSEVYGNPLEHPQKESYLGNVNPIGERACYDEGKRYMEALTMCYNREGVDTKIIRIFNTYGERMAADDGRVVSNFINQAIKGDDITVYGDGHQTRSLCYIDDLVDGIVLIAGKKQIKFPVNLGNDYEVSMVELAKLVKELCQSESNIIYEDLPSDDPIRRKPDLKRAKRLGYKNQISLEQGLINTIEYYKSLV